VKTEPDGASILVVDDDADIRETIRMVLGIQGYPVATVADGAEALKWLASGHPPPRLILLDLMMPGMNGFDLRAQLSADPRLSCIPIVVLTGASILADQRIGELRVQILRKPIELETLLQTVESVFSRGRVAPC
jgi:CheY-like chemotaxis protein